MQLNAKTAIITGGAKGIGAATARVMAAAGAKVVIADRDIDAAREIAKQINGLAVECDVSSEADIQNLVATAEAQFGPIDVFFSNAGLALGQGDHAASASNDDWMTNWNVHVMSHVYAARAVLPGMIERGHGTLIQMASAAGLLNQIGDAAYSTTKHAAVGFAESLAITHGAQGINVHVVCPQYVATPLLGYDDPSVVETHENLITPDAVAQAILKGMVDQNFMILPHAQVAEYIVFKAANPDKWIASMQALQAKVMAKLGGLRIREMHKLL